jgi:hypothetical protein
VSGRAASRRRPATSAWGNFTIDYAFPQPVRGLGEVGMRVLLRDLYLHTSLARAAASR